MQIPFSKGSALSRSPLSISKSFRQLARLSGGITEDKNNPSDASPSRAVQNYKMRAHMWRRWPNAPAVRACAQASSVSPNLRWQLRTSERARTISLSSSLRANWSSAISCALHLSPQTRTNLVKPFPPGEDHSQAKAHTGKSNLQQLYPVVTKPFFNATANRTSA